MRRFAALAISAAAALAVGNAQALVLVVDDFNTPIGSQLVFDGTGNDGNAVTGASLATSAGNLATTRTITHEMLTAGANGGNFSSVSVGNGSIPSGAIAMNNGSTVDSVATVTWSLSPTVLAGPVSFYFRVIQSNVGVPANNNVLDFSLNGSALGSFQIGNTANADVLFALTDAQITALSGGGTLTMVVNGESDWDLSLDSFGLSIPEPGTMALAGLALLGAGVAARRRKA
jgi:hypothetical protein